jgi:glyoxylase-like metal-dependent hydrolase (beta-lactamase superfamily II)
MLQRLFPLTLLFQPPISAAAAPSADMLARLALPTRVERFEASGNVADSSHPKHPGDTRVIPVKLAWVEDPELGEITLELVEGDDPMQRYHMRRGRMFQVDASGAKTSPLACGDLTAATLAALHPRAVVSALRERREAWRALDARTLLLAWNDALWTVELDAGGERVSRLQRALPHEQYGDGAEEIRYEREPERGAGWERAVVLQRGKEVARFALGAPTPCDPFASPAGKQDETTHAIRSADIDLVEVAPHVYSIDLVALNTRVTVAEFADHVVVLEGAYNSRICDQLARAVDERLHKPVRYFAFSHLHGQYIGGVRSWIHAGATVLCPQTTVPLIEAIAADPHTLRPDLLSGAPQPARVQIVEQRLRLEDAINTLDLIWLESGHTDDYLVFHFPKQKLLLSGDLLFYRPGQPLAGRSKQFAETVLAQDLAFESVRCTWPLTGYETRNVVTRDELVAALALSGEPR